MKRIVLVALAAIAVSQPALAWDFGKQDGDDVTWITAYDDDTTDTYQLAATCADDAPDEADITIYTGENWEETTSYASEVPLTIAVDGYRYGPLSASFQSFNGELGVYIPETADERVRRLFDEFRLAEREIIVSYFDKTITFGVDNARDAMGQFLEACPAR